MKLNNSLKMLTSVAILSMTLSIAGVNLPVFAQEAKKPLVEVASRPMKEGNVLSGLDVLKKNNFAPLKGKKVALLTNIAAIDREGNHILDLLHGNKNFDLVTLFSPEHGLYGDLDTKVDDSKDTATGLMVYSLYGRRNDSTTKPGYPEPKHLEGLDIVVVDLQDIGARIYTYNAFMGKMMEACARAGVEVMVLDRPNPLGGDYVDGALPDFDKIGDNTSYFNLPEVHGMTMGELAKMFNAEKKIGCKLTVVPVENWTRDQYFDETGLRWVNPSPNIQDFEAVLVYAGIGITESNMSMGRGTTEPFHIFGMPYIEDPQDLIDHVMALGVKGVRLEPVEFTPQGTLARHHPGEGQLCKGARMHVTDRKEFKSYALGLAVIDYMYKKYGTEYTTGSKGQLIPKYNIWRIRHFTTSWVCARIMERKPFAETLALVEKQVAEFLPIREKYLMYKSQSDKTQ